MTRQASPGRRGASSHPRLRRRLLRLAGPLLAPRARPPAPGPPRLLLLRPDHLGDLLLTSPAVALLEQSLPGAHLTYLVGPWGAAVARHGPASADVQTLAFPGFTRRPKPDPLAPYRLLWREAARLRAAGYHAAVVFRPDHWWGALLALAAGIPLRLGALQPETAPLLTHALPPASAQHAAEQALALARLTVATLGGSATPPPAPVFRITPAEHQAAARFFTRHALADRPVVALQPSAGAPLKSWPAARWAAVADELTRAGTLVLLAGGPDDGPLLDAVRARMAAPPAALLQGQPLGVAAAIYARCRLLIGPDGGAPHLAAAVGTPTVRLYGPAPPAVFGPWPPRPDQRVLLAPSLACAPCGALEAPPCGAAALPACLLALTVEQVVAVARDLLAGALP